MGTGILIFGLNGAGKSTLGRALAKRLRLSFIDDEDLFFPKTDARDPYAVSRTRVEAKACLLDRIKEREGFVLAAVKGDYGEGTDSLFQYAVWVQAPREIRLQRVRDRSFARFGERMQQDGDLYETEEAFFRFVASRPEKAVEDWARRLTCPVLRIDGTRPVEESVRRIAAWIVTS